MKATDYSFTIVSNSNFCDDPLQEELEYLVPFLPDIMKEMNRIMPIDEE